MYLELNIIDHLKRVVRLVAQEEVHKNSNIILPLKSTGAIVKSGIRHKYNTSKRQKKFVFKMAIKKKIAK